MRNLLTTANKLIGTPLRILLVCLSCYDYFCIRTKENKTDKCHIVLELKEGSLIDCGDFLTTHNAIIVYSQDNEGKGIVMPVTVR